MLSDEQLYNLYKDEFNKALIDENTFDDPQLVALRAVAEAAVKDAVGGDEPVAWEFQHEDTGLTMYECPQQVEWGFEKNNPRWKKIGPVYRRPQSSQLNLDYLREMGRLEARIRELEQASAAVPERIARDIAVDTGYADGWNDCIDEMLAASQPKTKS